MKAFLYLLSGGGGGGVGLSISWSKHQYFSFPSKHSADTSQLIQTGLTEFNVSSLSSRDACVERLTTNECQFVGEMF